MSKYPELLEEAMFFIDHKKLNAINYRKNNITKNNTAITPKQNSVNTKENLNSNENNQSGSKKENIILNKITNSATIKEKYSSNDY